VCRCGVALGEMVQYGSEGKVGVGKAEARRSSLFDARSTPIHRWTRSETLVTTKRAPSESKDMIEERIVRSSVDKTLKPLLSFEKECRLSVVQYHNMNSGRTSAREFFVCFAGGRLCCATPAADLPFSQAR
jgi:hypothetical protein